VKIIEVRLAIGFGGKSYVKLIGNLTDVQASVNAGSGKATSKKSFMRKNNYFSAS
jgi:microcompartment protein CcmL/EutN